jgi:hypothetical protein
LVARLPASQDQILKITFPGRRNQLRKRTKGEAFRAAVAKAFDLSDAGPAWVERLDQVVAAIDLVAELEARVQEDGLMLKGLHQDVIHPAVREIRSQRVALDRMLERLGLSEDGTETQSQAQRRRANARWHK